MHQLVYMGIQDSTVYACRSHHHQCWEITYYMDGEGINITNGIEYPFSAGTIVCQPPLLEHFDLSPAGYRNIFFEVENFHTATTEPIVIYDTDARDILTIIQLMYQEYCAGNDDRLTEAFLRILDMYLHRRMQTGDSSPFVERLKREIIYHYTDPNYHILKAIQEFPISESQLRRAFRRETGMTPQYYLQYTRLEHAKHLLLNETLQIGQVAHMCGYCDSYYFSRTFKKFFGLSPRDWRASQTESP